jgi:hypothetical protein
MVLSFFLSYVALQRSLRSNRRFYSSRAHMVRCIEAFRLSCVSGQPPSRLARRAFFPGDSQVFLSAWRRSSEFKIFISPRQGQDNSKPIPRPPQIIRERRISHGNGTTKNHIAKSERTKSRKGFLNIQIDHPH